MTRVKKGNAAGAATKKQSGTYPNAQQVRWINPSANVEDVAWLEGNLQLALEDVIRLFEELLVSERVVCKYDTHSTRWTAILFSGDGQEDIPCPALSVRGATSIDALMFLAYCAIRKYPEGWQGASGLQHNRFG